MKLGLNVSRADGLSYAIPAGVLASIPLLVMLQSLFDASVLFLVASALVLVCLGVASRASNVARWGVLLAAIYVALTFAIRPMVVAGNLYKVNTAIGLSAFDYANRLAVVCAMALVGFIALSFGWFAVSQSNREYPYGDWESRAIPAAGFIGFAVFGMLQIIGVLLLVRSAGGLANVFQDSSGVRGELKGNLYPLFFVWMGQVWGLFSFAGPNSTFSRFVGLTYVIGGSGVSLVLGSRGSALPPLLALIVIVASGRASGSNSHVDGNERKELTSWRLRRLFTLVLPLLVVGVLAGVARYTAGLEQLGPDANTSFASDPTYQFSESDNFALILDRRELLPSSPDLLLSIIQSPALAAPSALGVPRPVPYDFFVRRATLGGIVETGLPASLFGELWLIGGLPVIFIGCLLIGAALGRVCRPMRAIGSLGQIIAAVLFGHLYLILSRPLVLSLSRVLIFLLAIILVWLYLDLAARRRAWQND